MALFSSIVRFDPFAEEAALVRKIQQQAYEPLKAAETIEPLATLNGRVDVNTNRDVVLQFQVPAILGRWLRFCRQAWWMRRPIYLWSLQKIQGGMQCT